MKKLSFVLFAAFLVVVPTPKKVHLIVNHIENCNCRMALIVNGKYQKPVYVLKPKALLDTFHFDIPLGCTGISVDCNGKSHDFTMSPVKEDYFEIDFSKNPCK